MSEGKKLPVAMTSEQAAALDKAVIQELDQLPTTLPADHQRDPLLPEEFKDADALKSAVEAKLGAPVKKLVYAPFGEMLRDGARQFLAEEDPAFLARLDKYK